MQTWSQTVADELQKLGHRVEFWGPYLKRKVTERADLGIFANSKHTWPMAPLCGRAINVTHGVIRDEAPTTEAAIATSEEVKQYWSTRGPVLRQPLDLSFWSPANQRRELLVRFSYRGGLEYASGIAEALELGYVHLRAHTPEQCRDVLRRAACVLATGRAAVEAMASGAPVVFADEREYQGPLMAVDPASQMLRNYSGRGGVEPNAVTLADAIELAMRAPSDYWRAHAETHHDATKITGELLKYAGF